MTIKSSLTGDREACPHNILQKKKYWNKIWIVFSLVEKTFPKSKMSGSCNLHKWHSVLIKQPKIIWFKFELPFYVYLLYGTGRIHLNNKYVLKIIPERIVNCALFEEIHLSYVWGNQEICKLKCLKLMCKRKISSLIK